eukprot:SAG31_NODE_557_length_14160_cov_18.420880_3_plen_504_part_00
MESVQYNWSGTEVYNYWQRLLGARIGSGVIMVGVLGVLDPEFAEIGDNVVLEFEAAVRSHTHESHQLNMGRVRISSNMTLGFGASAMQLSICETNTEVAPESCVVKGQRLLSNAEYAGCPAQPTKFLPGYSTQNSEPTSKSSDALLQSWDSAGWRAGLSMCATEAAQGTGGLHLLFEQTAQAAANQCAVETCNTERRLTYEDINLLANAVATQITQLFPKRSSQSAQAEDVVALFLDRTDELPYVSMLAALKAGAAYLALDTTLPASQVAHMLADSSPFVIISSADLVGQLETDVLPHITGEGNHPNIVDVGRLLALGSLLGQGEQLISRHDCSERLCYLMYTSGSTGKPKAVQVEHKHIINLVVQESLLWTIEPRDRVLQAGSFSFDMSLEEIWFAFCNGAALVVADDNTVRGGPSFAEWLQQRAPTVVITVPTVLATISAAASGKLSTARILQVTGEPWYFMLSYVILCYLMSSYVILCYLILVPAQLSTTGTNRTGAAHS